VDVPRFSYILLTIDIDRRHLTLLEASKRKVGSHTQLPAAHQLLHRCTAVYIYLHGAPDCRS